MMRKTETSLLGASKELKDIVLESGRMAENLFETVNDGYEEMTVRDRAAGNQYSAVYAILNGRDP